MMFNDLTSPATLLATRRSGKARDLGTPGPDAAALDAILATAMRVPDHGKLAPWRFVVIDNRAAFAGLLAQAAVTERSAAEVEAARQFAHHAPVLVTVLSAPVVPHAIPVWEQELSAGAAIMTLMHAAHAHGFTANWLTTWAAYSPTVNAALGSPSERIAGFIFIGTPTRPLDERPRPDPAKTVVRWQG